MNLKKLLFGSNKQQEEKKEHPELVDIVCFDDPVTGGITIIRHWANGEKTEQKISLADRIGDKLFN